MNKKLDDQLRLMCRGSKWNLTEGGLPQKKSGKKGVIGSKKETRGLHHQRTKEADIASDVAGGEGHCKREQELEIVLRTGLRKRTKG